MTLWADASEAEAQRRFEQSRRQVLEKDELERAVREKDFFKAASLSLKLNRPHQLRSLLQGVSANEVETLVTALVKKCDEASLKSLLTFCVGWNSQSRSCLVAQRVIRVLLNMRDLTERVGRSRMDQFCDQVLPYTQRHQARFDKLIKTSYLIDHVCDV